MLQESPQVSELIRGVAAALYNKPEAPERLLPGLWWSCESRGSFLGITTSLAVPSHAQMAQNTQGSTGMVAGTLQRQDPAMEMGIAAGLMLHQP